MDFFDNAVNKAKEAIDIACKKTEEVVTVQKQKFDIATVENKLNKDFEKLGKLYFDTLKENEPENEEIKVLVAEIKDKYAKIRDLRDDINATKNKRICPNCSANIEKDSVFCSACGTKLEIDGE